MPGPAGPINIAQVRRGHELFLRRQDIWIIQVLAIAKDQAAEHVKKHSKFKRRSATRSLKDSTMGRIVKTRSGRKLRLRWSKKYASFIEYGTRPHPIIARRRRALAFVVNGQMLLRRKVMHPGTRPYKFGWKATSAAFRVLNQRLDARVRNARFRF